VLSSQTADFFLHFCASPFLYFLQAIIKHFSGLIWKKLLLLLQPFYGPLFGTTWVSEYQKKHSSTHLYHPTFIIFFCVLRSIASSLFNLHAWQSLCATSLQVLFGLPLDLEPSASYSMHFFTQSVSSFCNACTYHCNLFGVVPILYYLFLVCLSTLYLEVYLLP